MAFGIGIDTGGTRTDAVLFDLIRGLCWQRQGADHAEDPSIGTRRHRQAACRAAATGKVVALSTTLATNACVEGAAAPGCCWWVRRAGADWVDKTRYTHTATCCAWTTAEWRRATVSPDHAR